MSEFLKKIQSRGYWKVIIRPNTFAEKRIADFAELHPILQKTYVQLRNGGWEFPHLDYRTQPSANKDWIGQESEWEKYLELWRFYQSGQFVSFKGLYEDWMDNSTRYSPPTGWQPSQFLEIEDTLLQFTEIFEFASRLAFTQAGDEQMHLEISVHNLKGRGLKLDMQRKSSSWLRTLTASVNELPYTDDLPTAKLVANTRELALKPAVELFQRFGWNSDVAILRDIRDDLLNL